MDQGTKALNRQAIGNLSGGGTSADLVTFGQGLANQNYNNWYNQQAAAAGIGQTTANNLGSFGSNYANQVGNNAIQAGKATGSAYTNTANAWNQGIQGVTQGLGYWANNNTWGGI